MRVLLFIVCFGFTLNGFAQQVNFEEEEAAIEAAENEEESVMSTLTWLKNIDEAIRLAKTNKKKVLLYFTGSDWCSPCAALKKDFFETEAFESKADNFILVMIDYPRRKDILTPEEMTYNRKMITKYNKSKTFPKLIMLSSSGKEIGKLSGYSSYNSYKDISHHVKFIDTYVSN